jgi:hypothetical protein
MTPAPGVRPVFPPHVVVRVKALACELPAERGLPFSRFSVQEVANQAIIRGVVASISGATVWRWLTRDAIRPWRHRSWIFPRDPDFEVKAGRVLDLYHGVWEGEPLGNDDFVISADEKTSIQARCRRHPTYGPRAGTAMLVEHEYARAGALVYVAAWDVQRAKLFGRCEPRSGIVPFDRLVADVMTREPYASAKRVFWVVDNGSSHRGEKAMKRLAKRWRNLILVHLPIHASWLNQIEIYFSILQRKVLTPNDFDSLFALEDRILAFQDRYQDNAKPFEWKFTRDDLSKLLAKLALEKAA